LIPASPRDNGAAIDPLDRVAQDLRVQGRLCDRLEEIADGLPGEFSRFTCSLAIQGLNHDVPAHLRLQEDVVFPLLETRARPEDNLDCHLEQLRFEHAADECFAGEIGELLAGLTKGSEPGNPEAAGYMLRGFFEAYRRHITWEGNVLIPIARRRLTDDDIAALASALAALPLKGE
jgi:iron-sulfur cluster repair protein YtfE (RIC family)